MNILRIMSFVDESAGKELVLPVTPAKYTWRHPNRIETVRLDQLGEINLPGGARMGECTLEDVLLPAQLYPFCVPGARAAPQSYLYDLETWSDKGSKLRWIVSGTSINVSVMIEEITQGERDGSNDLYLTISLRQWRRPDAPVLAVSGGGAETPRETGTGAASAKTYTVVKGDCLWNIAKQFYGSGAEYKRLAAANPSIKNPNLIYPGQVLTIPAAADLPAAGTDYPSVKMAGAVKTQWKQPEADSGENTQGTWAASIAQDTMEAARKALANTISKSVQSLKKSR